MKIQTVVDAIEPVARRIKRFRLVARDGGGLPPWSAGAHLQVLMTLASGATRRAYSLIGAPEDRSTYEIAVQREPDGGGGSRHMHDILRPGDRVVVAAPVNAFPLEPGTAPVELLAGGIGLTPLLPMSRALDAARRSFRLTVFARSRDAVPFRAALEHRFGPRLALCLGGDTAAGTDRIRRTMARAAAEGATIYHCGPPGFATAVETAAEAAGIGPERLHTERFSAPDTAGPGHAFRLRLAGTGETCTVAPGQSALDALADAFGLELPWDCRAGYCGTCAQTVLRGTPEHRDSALGQRERSAGRICLCVSRARSAELVIDL